MRPSMLLVYFFNNFPLGIVTFLVVKFLLLGPLFSIVVRYLNNALYGSSILSEPNLTFFLCYLTASILGPYSSFKIRTSLSCQAVPILASSDLTISVKIFSNMLSINQLYVTTGS